MTVCRIPRTGEEGNKQHVTRLVFTAPLSLSLLSASSSLPRKAYVRTTHHTLDAHKYHYLSNRPRITRFGGGSNSLLPLAVSLFDPRHHHRNPLPFHSSRLRLAGHHLSFDDGDDTSRVLMDGERFQRGGGRSKEIRSFERIERIYSSHRDRL